MPVIEVRIDDRLRFISALLLFTEQGRHQAQFAPHPLKLRTLEWLAPHAAHPAMRFIRSMAAKSFISNFHTLAIHLGEPPDFALPVAERQSDLWRTTLESVAGAISHPPDLCAQRFQESLADLYNDTSVFALWRETAPAWEAVREQAGRALAQAGLEEWLERFFGPVELKLICVPMPTDPASFGFGPSNGAEAYAIMGPNCVARPAGTAGLWLGSGGKPAEILVGPGQTMTVGEDPFDYSANPEAVAGMCLHEFMHPLIEEFLQANPGLPAATEGIDAKLTYKGYFPKSYGNWRIRLSEMLIRAATAIYERDKGGPERGRAAVAREVEGYGLTPVEELYAAFGEYLEARGHGRYVGLADFGPELTDRLVRWQRAAG